MQKQSLIDPILCLLLTTAIIGIYGQTADFGFVNFDDPVYVFENPNLTDGLTRASVSWALTAVYGATWQPLVWLSYLLDVELYGLSPGGFHLTNLVLHLINTLLLFAVMRRLTGSRWTGLFIAGLFGLHPLNVEAVTWVSERKGLLSTTMLLLCLLSYTRYARRPGLKQYLPIMFFFTLGLAAKPMLVTLPFLLLLLDFRPLSRMEKRLAGPRLLPGLIIEKIPLFLLSAAACALAVYSQHAAGALAAMDIRPLGIRVENALVTYIVYLVKFFIPAGLSAHYPIPLSFSLWQSAGAGTVLVLISGTAVYLARRLPWLFIGWFWYLGLLLPVIGLVQFGSHALADRFMYVPMNGITLMLAMGAAACFRKLPLIKTGCIGGAIIIMAILSAVSFRQVQTWQNSQTLWTHALAVTEHNYPALYNLGHAYDQGGDSEQALRHYREALQINPDSAQTHHSIGVLLAAQGATLQSIEHYREALRLDPAAADTHNNLGNCYQRQGSLNLAIEHYRAALRSNPQRAQTHYNLGQALEKQGRPMQAFDRYTKALILDPSYIKARSSLAIACARSGRLAEAVAHFKALLKQEPGNYRAHNNLGAGLLQSGNPPAAARHFRQALRLRPHYPDAQKNLGRALKQLPKNLKTTY
ncbi:MAG: tetratricopeptide repeat protein [Deltaproteobacteria bacterium]|nr:tetratricopeptide repeat protein [Deltaproteobacteria bacterium]